MNTQFRESVDEVKQTVRNAFIVPGEPSMQSSENWETMTWREAGTISFMFAALGLGIFGLHYLVYGRHDGEPSRDTLVTMFSTVTAMLGAKARTWKVRCRFLASLASAMAIVGIFLRFVVRESVAFSPIHLAAILAILVLIWLGFDSYEKLRGLYQKEGGSG